LTPARFWCGRHSWFCSQVGYDGGCVGDHRNYPLVSRCKGDEREVTDINGFARGGKCLPMTIREYTSHLARQPRLRTCWQLHSDANAVAVALM
jgi:hypothetical protein